MPKGKPTVLSPEQKDEIIAAYNDGEMVSALKARYAIGSSTLNQILGEHRLAPPTPTPPPTKPRPANGRRRSNQPKWTVHFQGRMTISAPSFSAALAAARKSPLVVRVTGVMEA